jgi:hypothetical protein
MLRCMSSTFTSASLRPGSPAATALALLGGLLLLRLART